MFSWRLKCYEMRSIVLHWDGLLWAFPVLFCFLTPPLTHSLTCSGPHTHLPAPYKTVKTHICNVFLTKQKQIRGHLSSHIYTRSQAVWSPCLFRSPASALRIPCPSASTQAKPHADLQSDNAIILLYISFSSHPLAKPSLSQQIRCATALLQVSWWIDSIESGEDSFFFFFLIFLGLHLQNCPAISHWLWQPCQTRLSEP